VLLATVFLIVGMFVSPLLLTFQCDLVILGVSRKFLAVILGAAPTLALRFTADDLLGTENGRHKRILAVRTTAGQAQADSSEMIGINGRITEENRNHEGYASVREKTNLETDVEFLLRLRRPGVLPGGPLDPA